MLVLKSWSSDSNTVGPRRRRGALRAVLLAMVLMSAMTVGSVHAEISSEASASPTADRAEELKTKILTLAKKFQGQGDPDGRKQLQLDRLVRELLRVKPQPPIAERLHLLYGPWRQVWGPYEYRRGDRSVDPTLDPKNIVQVVFPGGYYYNVNPNRDENLVREDITLLRGEFRLSATDPNGLDVQFTNLRRVDLAMWQTLRLSQMPALSEAGQLRGERTVLPGFIVRLFFGGGQLREVYTDETLRLAYGTSRDGSTQDYLYVLRRTR